MVASFRLKLPQVAANYKTAASPRVASTLRPLETYAYRRSHGLRQTLAVNCT